MKKILNVLYVTTDGCYLSLDGENVVINKDHETIARIPLHTIEGVVSFGFKGVSPALMGKCAELNKQIVFLSPNGKFLARSIGKQYGNILLRRKQFSLSQNERMSIAKNIISAKLYNSASVLRRGFSDHPDVNDAIKLKESSISLKDLSKKAYSVKDDAELRGMEGEGGSIYFSVFNQLICQNKDTFDFNGRTRRPPLDRVNAMLSFGYSLLTSMCVSALETVGLDPYCGVFHVDRPGRCSLALDLEEEFRAYLVDRFVLTLINRKMVNERHFAVRENGAVSLNDEGRKIFLQNWFDKKKEVITHPYLGEKMEIGFIPHVQALLLGRYFRGDLSEYPPFLWK